MTRAEVLADIAQLEADLRATKHEAEKRLDARGFLDKFELLDYEARMTGARQKIHHLKHELLKIP